jgi:methionyl-tRNA formyltransferase
VRILFWGTPEFATPTLRALLGEGFDVVGVVTQPDRPQGRSRSVLVPSPVKEIAVAEGLDVLQPTRPRGQVFLEDVRALSPDVSAVVAYGHILVPEVIGASPSGMFNLHASLLPALRGAAPVQAAIREGLDTTGVTVMRIVPALDAGPVLLQIATPIAPDETYGELLVRLSELGAQAVVEALTLVELGAATETAQDDSRASYAPKVDRHAARVNWSRTAVDVARSIRAYDPKPGAVTLGPAGDVKLFGAQVVTDFERGPADAAPPAGTVLAISDDGIVISCGTGALRVARVQPAARPPMSPADWARGRGIAVGSQLGA